MRIKVVILGGSSLSTPLFVEAIGRNTPLADYELILVGRDLERLEMVRQVSQEILQGLSANINVNITTQLEAALEGADYCINQIRPGGLEGRLFDETFPVQFGIPGEETLGPGGFSSACRSVPTVLQICQVLEKSAPNAILLNLTNPCSLVQYAIRRYSKVNVIGLCELPIIMMEAVAALLEVQLADLKFELAGMNHHSWITAVRQGRQDRLPDVLTRVDELPKLRVDPKLVQAFGAIPSPFMRYYFHPDRVMRETSGKPARAQELIELGNPMLKDFKKWQPQSGTLPLSLRTRGAVWYEKIVAPVLVTLAEKRSGTFPLNIENQGALPYLPGDAIVETLVNIKNGELQKPHQADIPNDINAMLESHYAFETFTAQAVVEHDRKKAIRALLSDRFVQSYAQADQIINLVFDPHV